MLFVSDNLSTNKTAKIQKKLRRNFILSKNILSSQLDKNNTFDESIFVCSEYSNSDTNNQHSSSITETSNNYNINNEENPTLLIDRTYTGNINSSNTLNNNEFEVQLSSYQDNTKQSPSINYDIEGYFCHNRNCNNTLDYFLLYKVQLLSLNKKKIRFISSNNCNNQNKYIFLCKECLTYFSNKNTTRKNIKEDYNLLWPSFIWYILSNEKGTMNLWY